MGRGGGNKPRDQKPTKLLHNIKVMIKEKKEIDVQLGCSYQTQTLNIYIGREELVSKAIYRRGLIFEASCTYSKISPLPSVGSVHC